MLKEERHAYIADLLRREGKVLSAALAARLHVSEDTIRRDLDELATAGTVQRVHGGALPRLPLAAYDERDGAGEVAKGAIAAAAADLARDGQLIVMDSGTTVLAVARRLPPTLRATVLTNSVPVAAALACHPAVAVHMVGGALKKEAQALVGVPAVEALRAVRADLCYLGICSLHPEVGISVPDDEEAQVKRAMVQNAAEVVAVTGSEKLGAADRYVVGPLRALTQLVTDRAADDAVLAPFRDQGITVIQVSHHDQALASLPHRTHAREAHTET